MLEVYFKNKWVIIDNVKYSNDFRDTEIVSATYEDGTLLTEDELYRVWVDCGGEIYDEWLNSRLNYSYERG